MTEPEITPEIYEEMNREFEEEGTMVRIKVPTQEGLDKWKQWIDPHMHERTVEPVDMVAEMWRKHREEQSWKEMDKEIEMMFGSEYEAGIDYE
tara:strand:- start:75 stop:353 length:279 start_codon:yes stop_codon:yes gene_type:complete